MGREEPGSVTAEITRRVQLGKAAPSYFEKYDLTFNPVTAVTEGVTESSSLRYSIELQGDFFKGLMDGNCLIGSRNLLAYDS